MIYLFVDTSSSNACVSFIKDNKIIFEFKEKIESDMSSKILPIIDDGLSKIKHSLKDVRKIFVVDGPGSFTGIRIGITICKVIGWALSIPIVPISSLELIATTQTSKKYRVPMIDARRGNVFAGIYDEDLNIISEDKLINIDDLIKNFNDDYELISYDNISVDGLIKPNLDLLKIVNKHLNDKEINPHKLKPNYLKLTEAEENRIKND